MLKKNYKKIILVVVVLLILQYFIPFHVMNDRENLEYLLIDRYPRGLKTSPTNDDSSNSIYSDDFKNDIYDILSKSSMYKVFPLYFENGYDIENTDYDYFMLDLDEKEKNKFDIAHDYDVRITLAPDGKCYVYKEDFIFNKWRNKTLYRFSKKDADLLKEALSRDDIYKEN